jgi:hypothetical protein
MRAWLTAALLLGLVSVARAEDADTTATSPAPPRPRVAAPT